MKDEEIYPVYFVMNDECPNEESFMRMAYELREFNYYFRDKFQKYMIMTVEQTRYFMQCMANRLNLNIPSGDSSNWEFAGFRIKTIKCNLME